MIDFQNTYSKLPSHFFEFVEPESFANPKLLLFNDSLARDLGIKADGISDERLAQIFSGQEILKGSEPLAQAYAAHQFGHFVPQLGDGRAHLLGETKGFDIQLKGSGRTPFSRRGDGLSALGPVIREYIVSEGMHFLGVPTTRALAAVSTGENVRRDGLEPGGVFTRVASSHLRVGTFQYFLVREDREGIETLMNYAIKRHYPELLEIDSLSERALAFFKSVGERQADLVSSWMSYGFIHGVMNTDNFSVAGITIDFGPCAFMDEFRENKVFSSIDHQGRYAYSNQIPIAQWNLLRLADCLLELIDENQDEAIKKVEKEISSTMELFFESYWKKMTQKFGIKDYQVKDQNLVKKFLRYLEKEGLDFTMSFRKLPDLYHGDLSFYQESRELKDFLEEWKKRARKIDDLNKINPLFIARNHQVQRAIEQIYEGNDKVFKELVEVLKSPFDDNEKFSKYALLPKVEERVYQTFCGT